MKKHINPFKAFALVAVLSAPLLLSAADGDNIEKKKTISKSYTVGKDDKLSIDNSFGEVTINTWDKNEVKVDVEISVHAATDDKAQHMMDQISVSDNQGGNTISFKTDIGNMGNGKNKGEDKDRKFYVDYKVYMPAANPLTITNSFGATTVPDFDGTVDLTSKFGELKTGRLSNVKSIHVEFGQASVQSARNGEITLKFNGKSHFEQIGGSVKCKVEFCNDVQFGLTDGITDLSLFESYSNINMTIPGGLSSSFEVHTSFGKFYNSTGYSIRSKDEQDQYGPKFDSDYSGVNGDGKVKIKIKSSFGKVHLFNTGDKNAFENEDKEEKNEQKEDEKEDIHI
jgi:hypothetical protein